MRVSQIIEAAKDFDMNIPAAIGMRIRYLQALLLRWNAYIDEQTNEIPESDVMAIIGELVRIRKWQDNQHKGAFKDVITDEMIQAAREYPIEQLFDFGRTSRIPCPFHNSKGPDLSWHKKSNTVHCFGACGKSWGPIDTIMIHEGVDFITAVKHLNGGRV